MKLASTLRGLRRTIKTMSGVQHMAEGARIERVRTLLDPRMPELIKGLVFGEVAAIVVEEALPPALCRAHARHAQGPDGPKFDRYAVEPNFAKAGIPLFQTTGNPLLLQRYFDSAPVQFAAARSAVPGGVAPGDLLRVLLDEMWPAGAQLLHLDGRAAPFALHRVIEPGGPGVQPHVDMSRWDCPRPPFLEALANLSLVAGFQQSEGAETILYPVSPWDRQVHDAWRDPASEYALRRDVLPPPIARHQVREGEALIFNAEYVHEVSGVPSTSIARHTLSGFLLVTALDAPLQTYH